MPKQKTKSGAKKRFKFTANGHVKVGQAGKRHGMIKRTTKFIRKARGTMVLDAAGREDRQGLHALQPLTPDRSFMKWRVSNAA